MAHENLSRDQEVEGSSDRAFGWVFAIFFLIISCWPMIKAESPRWWALCLAMLFGLAALFKPLLLASLNKWWMKFGVLLGKIVSPIALGVLFYLVFTPVGAIIRVTGKDPLRLKRDAAAGSYWVPRHPPGPPPDSMSNQF